MNRRGFFGAPLCLVPMPFVNPARNVRVDVDVSGRVSPELVHVVGEALREAISRRDVVIVRPRS